MVLVVEQAADAVLNSNLVDSINASKCLRWVDTTAMRHDLATNLLEDSSGTVQLERSGLGLGLSLLETVERQVEGETDQALADAVHQAALSDSVRNHVHTEQAGVRIEGVERSQGLSELAIRDLLDDGGRTETTTNHVRVVRTNQLLDNLESVGVGIVPATSLEGISNVCKGHVIIADKDVRASELRRSLESGHVVRSRDGNVGEELLSQTNKLLVLNCTSTDNGHARANEVRLLVSDDVVAAELADLLRRAEDG